ncbi:putative odorant receptor 83c [Ochlerotatus camptorhynchus]|uniref:putative odorant receptor 83c n=1 Tax=Ochlerotatus camptorhynchus TaxID=644619 RepID=UPI0031DFE0A5
METLKRFKKFHALRSEVKDPHKTFEDIIVFLNGIARNWLGMDVTELDFSFVNPRYIFLLLIMSSFLYADVEAAILSGDVGGFAYNIAVLGFGLQGFAKFEAYVYRKEAMYTLIRKIYAFLAKNKENDRLNEILKNNVTVVLMMERFYIGLYGFVFVTMSIFGLITSLFTGERQLSFGFQFSFLDTSQWPGFVLTYIYQVIGVLMVVISSCCNDVLIVAVYVNALAMYDCIMSDLKELSKESQQKKSPTNLRIAEERMKSIITQHQDLLDFLNLSNEVFSSYFLMSLACMTGTIAVLLIALVWVRWYSAIVICFAASFQIFSLCLLGTLLLVKSEELIEQVYIITWYDLDLSVQQSLKLLLLMSQNIKEISYRFGVMNMETYVQSHKMIYSFFTMLVTTQE